MSRTIFATLLLSLAVLGAACGGSEKAAPTSAAGASYPMSIRLSDGETLTLTKRPERIVSLSAHATEIFCAVGAEPQLIAVERFANCPLGSKSKPELDAFRPNLEAIAGTRPDLVYVSTNSGEIVANLRRLGVPVLYIEVPKTLEGVLDHIRTLGAAVGRADEAEKLTSSMRARLDRVKARVAGVGQGPRVFHELDTDYYSAGPGSFIGDFYNYLKAQNIAAGATGDYPQLSAEVIVQRNPQVIVLADEAAGVTAAAVRARPGWGSIDAVRDNRICVVDPDIVSRPGPRVVDALEALAKCLYPGQF